MKLKDLNPRWFDVPGVGTDKDGISFFCPCARCQASGNPQRLGVQFANPVGSDPKPQMTAKQNLMHIHELRTFDVPPGTLWQRDGETFDDMTLHPSIDASNSGHWHGLIQNGEIR